MQKAIMLFLLFAYGPVQASEWVSLGKSADEKSEASVDVSGIRITGTVRRAWSKMVFPPHTAKGSGPNSDKWKSSEVSLEAFDCDNQTGRTEAVTIYYYDGSNWTAPAASFPFPWTPVPPDTALSVAMQFICAWKPK